MPIDPRSELGIRVEKFSKKRVALIHDWMITYRGGERVLAALAELFPQADIFTLFHRPGELDNHFVGHRIQSSFLSKLPGAERYYRWLLPLFPMAIESFSLNNYDLVISSSHCVAKGVIVAPEAMHLSYCHTTMRYAWDQREHYFKGKMRQITAPFLHYLRMWDVTSAARVDRFVANSSFVAQRIEKYYRRPARVVHPFVDLQTFKLQDEPREDFYLCVTALVPYKNVQAAILACRKQGRRLKIVGDGPMRAALEKLAGPETEFLGPVSNVELAKIYARSRALLFPGIEDFGITPLEAMACGTPVIGLARGGLLDSVVDGLTGILYTEDTTEGLAQAIERFETDVPRFDPKNCRARSETFSKQRFQEQILDTLELPPSAGEFRREADSTSRTSEEISSWSH